MSPLRLPQSSNESLFGPPAAQRGSRNIVDQILSRLGPGTRLPATLQVGISSNRPGDNLAETGSYQTPQPVIPSVVTRQRPVPLDFQLRQENSGRPLLRPILISQPAQSEGELAGGQGLNPDFQRRLRMLFNAVPGLKITSGYRSVAEQAALWEKYGHNRRRVAPPGKSQHNFGLAADISGPASAMARAHALAPQFGLHFPMSWEPWHIQPIGISRGSPPEQKAPIATGLLPMAIGPFPMAAPRRAVINLPTGSSTSADPMMAMMRDLGYL